MEQSSQHIPLLDRFSLTLKITIITLLSGLIAWAVLDHYQSRQLRLILQGQLEERLDWLAKNDRNIFDNYVRAHGKATKLFTSHVNFARYMNAASLAGWSNDESPEVQFMRRPPEWFPETSTARAFIKVRYALLFDARGRVREVFQAGPSLPETFYHPNRLLQLLTHSQTLMTMVDDNPYLISSESVLGEDGLVMGTMMLVAPIDDQFLSDSQGAQYADHLIALFSDEPQRVLASSDSTRLVRGTPVEKVMQEYLVTGKSFFDYGASDLLVQFTTLISTEQMEKLSHEIITLDRRNRLIGTLLLIFLFILIIMTLTRKINVLTQKIINCSEDMLGTHSERVGRGDQLCILHKHFDEFTREIVSSREELRKEAEEKLALLKTAIETEEHGRQLKLLQIVTDVLGVGVLSCSADGLKPLNALMDVFSQSVGGADRFVTGCEPKGKEELTLRDVRGRVRVFDVSSPAVVKAEQFVMVRDVTDLNEAQEKVRKLTLAVEQSPAMVVITDTDGIIEYINPRFTEVTGFTPGEVIGRSMTSLCPGCMTQEVLGKLRDGSGWRGEMENRRKDGSAFWETNSISSIVTPEGRLTHFLFVKEDITERKLMEERLRAISITDELTGLVNRRGFITLAEQQLYGASRRDVCLHMLYMDMDNMKWINDTYGHAEGDEALKVLASLLREIFRKADIIGRLGGDEFAVLAEAASCEEGELNVIERLDLQLEAINSRPGRRYSIEVSTGIITHYPGESHDIDRLLSRADALMYEIKKRKKSDADSHH